MAHMCKCRLGDLSFIKYVYQILAVNEFSGLVFTCASNTYDDWVVCFDFA